jgi:hypothetical protein
MVDAHPTRIKGRTVMEVHNESSVKTGAAAPVKTEAPAVPTKKELAQKGQEVLDAFQEATVLGRRTTEALVKACQAYFIFEQDAKRAKADDELSKVVKGFNLKPDRVGEYLKRVRTTGEAAAHSQYGEQFSAIQHAIPPYLECTYEAAKIVLHGTDKDRKKLLDAVTKGNLTVNSTKEDIRAIRSPRPEHASSSPKSRRSTSTITADVSPESMTDEQIAAQLKTQGITSPAKQQEFVRKFREPEAADAVTAIPRAAVVDVTLQNRITSAEPQQAIAASAEPHVFRF